jgi:predicted transcriptional regulator
MFKMNNFNKIFLLVRKSYDKQADKQKGAKVNCFDGVVKEANIPLDQLSTYLEYLQQSGLIKYSLQDKSIYLTSFGKKQKSLIKDE